MKQRVMAWVLLAAMAIGTVAPAPVYGNSPFDIPVPKLTAKQTDLSKANTLVGTDKARALVNEVYYNDIRGSYGHEQIVRMTALGVLNNYGDRAYRPAAPATGFELIRSLVRLRGREGSVMQRVYAQSGSSTSPERLTGLLNREYMAEAQTLGIVQQPELKTLQQPVTRERAALWTGRAISGQLEFVQTQVFSFSDWAQVNPTYRSMLEGLIAIEVVPLLADGRFDPKGQLTRAEMAVWLAGAFERYKAQRATASGFGLVIGAKMNETVDGNNRKTTTTVTVRNVDGSVTQLNAERNTVGGWKEYITYRGGIISVSTNIQIGDEIEYITMDGALRYARVVDNGLVLDKMKAAFGEADVYHRFHTGNLIDIRRQQNPTGGKNVTEEIYRVADVSGDVFDIIVVEDNYTGIREDIITSKNDKSGGVKLLEVGDVLEYLVDEKREVVYIKVGAPNKLTLTGTVREVFPQTDKTDASISIYGYDEKTHRFPIAPYATHQINRRAANLKDFVYGLPVRAEVTNGYITVLHGESFEGDPGYIPPFGKMRMGKVISKYPTDFRVETAGGERFTVTIDSMTQFTKSGNLVSYGALKPGEEVKIFYDSIGEANASRVEIEAPEMLFDIIYKGKIRSIVGQRQELQLIGTDGVSKPEFIRNNQWEQAETYAVDLNLSDNTKIYAGDRELTPEMLSRFYPGAQAYAVVKQVYGKPTVVSLSIKTGGELLHSSSVRTVDHTKGEFELLTRDNFTITKGTILIRDGLVIPNTELKPRDTVLVASETPTGSYEKQALFVKVTSAHEDIFDRIRIGAVEGVGVSSMTFANHTQFVNNRLDPVNPNTSGSYKFYTNSLIRDITDPDAIKTLTPSKFFHDKYARTENAVSSGPGLRYKRYYAFAVVNPADKSIIAMNMRHKGLQPLNPIDDRLSKEEQIAKELDKIYTTAVLSRGIVAGNDPTWNRIEITDAHDFTNYTGRWTATTANIFIKYTDAIIVKNNVPITVSDIRLGDYLYIMRLGSDALVIFVE
ncbi:MAG: S-layer homology domain-containing protein [Bacillota bacterium]|nr:S-layer homology domain-containing protein [Bacillota bacterium]